MTTFRVVPDPDGWINTVMSTEWAHEPVDGQVTADPETAEMLMALPRVARYDGARVTVPHDDRVLWRVLRASGLSGPEAADCRSTIRAMQARCPDVPANAPLPAMVRQGKGSPTHDYPDVPGLTLRAFTPDDLDLAAPLAIESGIYPATCPDAENPCCRPPEAHAWCALARRVDQDDTWQMTLEFNGRPLQFELVTLHPVPVVTLTMHLTRERPRWFWREAEAPVFNALRAEGHRTLRTRTRKDRPDWIESLKANYGAAEIAETDRVKVLEFPLETTFAGWPARPTAGPGWTLTVGPVTMREGTEADLPACHAAIDALWPEERIAQRTQLHTMLDAWWSLDRAALLIGTDPSGRLRYLRAVRMRRPGVSQVSWYLPVTEVGQREAGEADKAWQRAVGFSRMTFFLPASHWDHPSVRAHALALGFQEIGRPTFRPGPYVEGAIDL